ncbi:hypothetical protein [Neisseria wadsworthii]|uniref:hypothetical protein n=1 Tax=Neisseria wadsworthii TaxID=607711 RepID=UPI0012EA854C|nr:hypothetical protein [Neisseria wadsworthii]QMT36236.1 hypothetical protein H3L96_03090 [Neisseria wadsworthii]
MKWVDESCGFAFGLDEIKFDAEDENGMLGGLNKNACLNYFQTGIGVFQTGITPLRQNRCGAGARRFPARGRGRL